MGNLFTQENVDFRAKIEKMPIEELQKLIWILEAELKKMENTQKTNIRLQPELDRVGIPKPMMEMKERMAIKSKISSCQDILYRRLYSKVDKAEEYIDYGSMFNTKWGIIEIEPQIIIENAKTDRTYWKKYGGNEPVQEHEKMSIAHMGDFYWTNNKDIDLINLFKGTEQIKFKVPRNVTQAGKVEVQAGDLVKGYEKVQNGYTKLKMVKVTLQGAETLEYFMLMDIPQIDKINPFELEKFLSKTYISTPHQEQVKKSLQAEKCLFGGIIDKNSNGNLQLIFDDKNVNAIVQANNYLGTYKTLDGKEKTVGCLQDAIDLSVGRQNRRENTKSLKAIKTGLEGR